MSGTIKLDDIAVFLAVASSGSMTQVANRYDLPKSTVSRIVRRLEEQFGVRLFERSTRHLRLTEDGRHLVEQTRPLVDRLQETIEQSVAHADSLQGVLRISAPYEFGLMRLGEVVTDLLQSHPALEINLDLSSRTPDPRAEDYDIVFRVQAGDLPDSDQVARRVYAFQRGLFAAPKLLERLGRPANLSELTAMPCLGSPDEPVWSLIDPENQLHEFQPFCRLRTLNAAMRLQGIVAGLGVGMISLNYCREALRRGQIVPILENWACVPARVYALLPARRLMPQKVMIFLDALEKKLARPLGNVRTTLPLHP